MRIPARLVLPSLLAVVLASACTGNSPTPPTVVAAGWSWNPALAGDRPLPVIWNGSSTPQALPLLGGGTCPASGSVQAMAIVSSTPFVAGTSGLPFLAGISALCSGADEATMLPALWTSPSLGVFVANPLPLPAGTTQGTALAVATQYNATTKALDVFVGGAVGNTSPFPVVWRCANWFESETCELAKIDPASALPTGYTAGVVTSIAPGENFVVAGGIIYKPATSGSPAIFSAVIWVLDPDFTAVIPQLLPLPDGVASANFGRSVALELVSTTVLSATSISTGPGLDKPLVYTDDVPLAVEGLDFTASPYGVPTGLSMNPGVPYLSGFVHQASRGGLPAPVIWGGTAMETLSSVDPTLGVGAGEAIAVLYEHAYVAGETYRGGTSPAAALVSVPAWWDNGNRHDLAGLVAAGSGPIVSQPLFGWWRLPLTPATAAPDWPYTGGFAEIDAAAAPVSAAGSGVAKVIGLVPK